MLITIVKGYFDVSMTASVIARFKYLAECSPITDCFNKYLTVLLEYINLSCFSHRAWSRECVNHR